MKVRAVSWVLALMFGLVACGGDDSGTTAASCATDPLSCGAGKTCWVVDDKGKYDCVAATTDKPQGTACQNLVGSAQCNEGLMCFPGAQGTASGSCQPFCAKDKTCANAAQCVGIELINLPSAPTVYACTPSGSGGSAGTGGGTGTGGSSGGAAGSGGSSGGAAGSGGSSGGSDAGGAEG